MFRFALKWSKQSRFHEKSYRIYLEYWVSVSAEMKRSAQMSQTKTGRSNAIHTADNPRNLSLSCKANFLKKQHTQEIQYFGRICLS